MRGANKANLSRIPKDKPIMLVGGGKDPATRGAKGMHWMETHMKGLGFAHISKQVYPEARHETLNDIVADKATLTLSRGLTAFAPRDEPSNFLIAAAPRFTQSARIAIGPRNEMIGDRE